MIMYYIPKDTPCTNKDCVEVLREGELVALFEGELFCEETCVIEHHFNGIGFKCVELTKNKIYMDGDW